MRRRRNQMEQANEGRFSEVAYEKQAAGIEVSQGRRQGSLDRQPEEDVFRSRREVQVIGPDSGEELRVIAADSKLAASDKAIISKAADDLDEAYRTILLGSQQATELHAYVKALQDRVRAITTYQPWSMGCTTSWTLNL